MNYFFRNGNFPGEEARKAGFDPDRETYQWLLLLQKADKMGIAIAPLEVARFAQNMIGQFRKADINSPDAFIQRVLLPKGFQVDDLERFVRHFLMVQELISTVGMPGKLITPDEARSLYEREHQELATEAVFFSLSNHLAAATPPGDAIYQFYTNRQAFYRVPDRVQVKYVEFPVSNFTAQAEAELMKTNFNEIVDAQLRQFGTNYTRFGKTPEEAKIKIREEIIKNFARTRADGAARKFAGPLMGAETINAGDLEISAKTNGLTIALTAPFDRETGPQEIEVGMDFATRAFALTPAEPIVGPIRGQNGVYVIALEKKIPSEIPPLEQIRARVIEDYKTFQALNQARMEGAMFGASLTNELAQGKSFASICLNSKLKPVSLPPFSISTQDIPDIEGRVSMNQLKQLAFTTPIGQASGFQPTPEGGIILFVKSKLPVDVARMNAELPAFLNRARMNRENDAFQAWFRKEAEKGLHDIPALKTQPPALGQQPGQRRS